MDRLTSMAVFIKAVDLGSFAAAADNLNLSSPMVGKHVKFLEERLGVRLITRTTRRQSLTDFGKVYYERCQSVLAEVDAADALAADQLSEPRGKLRITMPVHFGRHCVAPILFELARSYPSLELELSFNDRFVDLADGDYDLSIRTGELDDKAGIKARRIARQSMVLCASPSYIAMHGELSHIDELINHDAIVYRRSGLVRPWLFPVIDKLPVEVLPTSRLQLDDLEAIADAAASNMGVAWLPYWLINQRIQNGDLVQMLPNERVFLYDAYALWLKVPQMPLKLRLAIDALVSALPKLAEYSHL